MLTHILKEFGEVLLQSMVGIRQLRSRQKDGLDCRYIATDSLSSEHDVCCNHSGSSRSKKVDETRHERQGCLGRRQEMQIGVGVGEHSPAQLPTGSGQMRQLHTA